MDDNREGLRDPAGGTGTPRGGFGIYDGFEAYRTVTEADLRRALTEGLIVLDTNVLLHLYRVSERARAEMLAALEAVGPRLWVPHQVMLEFWANRESVLRDPRDVLRTTTKLADLRDQAVWLIRHWSNRVTLDPERAESLARVLGGGFDTVIDDIARVDGAEAAHYARDTAADPVLRRLEPLLAGRVGPRPTAGERAAWIEEARDRIARRVPPGYRDAGKPGDGPAGDYLVWTQVLAEAREVRRDVVFVTGDSKEDWWRREHGEPRGPRAELVTEMREHAGVRLFQLRPHELFAQARAALGVAVGDATVEDLARAERLYGAGGGPLGGGWVADTLRLFLERLDRDAPVQATVLHQAVQPDGRVRREDVHRLGRYDELRPLRDFTRPVARMTQEFRDRGLVPPDALDPLVDEYDELSVAHRTVAGFRVPPEVLPVLVAVLAEDGGQPVGATR